MYYLSRFPVNMSRYAGRELASSFYKMHAAVAGCFPAGSIPDGERPLWRLDTMPDKSRVLYIVSPVKPSLVGLDEQIGYPDLEPQYKTCDYDKFLANIECGDKYMFKLFANTVHSVECSDGKVRRIGHVTVPHRISWLVGREDQDHSRAMGSGFHIAERDNGPAIAVTGMSEMVDKKPGIPRAKQITLSCTEFEGELVVDDADKFRSALVKGIGRAKFAGCGLLTVAPSR